MTYSNLEYCTEWNDDLCHFCNPKELKPGSYIKTDNKGNCVACGRHIKEINIEIKTEYYREKLSRWDTYFHTICKAVSSKSPCLSRQIGAILVNNNSILSTGYNGPARGYPHCIGVPLLTKQLSELICPRRAKGFKSGEGLDICPAAHAEANCIANAARTGASTIGATLYINCIISCKDCAIILTNAGITEVVVEDTKPYHNMSIDIFKKANIKVRKFILKGDK